MKKTLVVGLLFLSIILFGTSGYVIIEECSFLDGLFMTMITITTVGFSEVIPLSPIGKIFTIVLIVLGVGFVMFVFGKITEAVVEGGLRTVYGRMNMNKKVAKLKNHYIVCGFGRIGRVICKLLHDDNRPFVVIDNDPKAIKMIEEQGYLFLEGEAACDEILIRAGLKKAEGLIAVVSSDADNVFIVLSARGLNADLFIMARSSGIEGLETKLLRAGADKVISPYYIGGCRMAQLLLRPTVTDFIDLTVHGGELGLRLEELVVHRNSQIVDKSLMDSGIRKKFDLIVVAIKRIKGDMIFNPNPNTEIKDGDTLVLLGQYEKIKELEKEI
ncbi:MAG: potassium channel protein [Thermodesulfobacteriota bacterium]|nr:potassium channel protein [Thermodesulfobacteriota bacterium]